jgi:glyoxylase-like metal-dependent hydrolase (beta-lactamase superfamily II)
MTRSNTNVARRTVLAGLGAALLAPASRSWAAPYRRTVGAAEVTVLSDGALNVPLAFMLPETKPEEVAVLSATLNQATPGSAIPTNVTLVRIGRELILIDAGAGGNFQPTAGKLGESLEAAGIEPAQITRVVFTHGHADHLWGTIDEFDELRFPNASYAISAAEWDFWTDPDTPSRVPDWLKGMALGSARILKRLEGRIERRKADDTVAPGLHYVATPGHTPGHMSVLLDSDGAHLLIGGDALTHAAVSFARPDWRLGTDFDRDQAVATRRRLLDRLATDRLSLIGFHLPYPGAGVVERKDTAYRFVPV